MVLRIPWDKYETALLIEGWLNIEQGAIPKQKAISVLSRQLRRRAIAKGIAIDEKFRNENGISLQLMNLDRLINGKTGGTRAKTKMFVDMVNVFFNDRKRFERILNEAKSGSDTMETWVDVNKERFAQWLQKAAMPYRLSDLFLAIVDLEAYAKKKGLCNESLYEIKEPETIRIIIQKLEADRSYRFLHRRKIRDMLDVARLFFTYTKDNYLEEFLLKTESAIPSDAIIQLGVDGTSVRGTVTPVDCSELKVPSKNAQSVIIKSFVLDFEKDKDFADMTPVSVSYFDEEYEASSWRDLYLKILELLFVDYPSVFKRLRDSDFASCFYSEADSDFLTTPMSFARGYYVDVNRNASEFIHNIKKTLDACKVDYEELVIRYRKESEQQTEEIADELTRQEETSYEENALSIVEDSDFDFDETDESSVVDFENDADFSCTTPLSVSYFDDETITQSWADIYLAVLKSLYSDYPRVFKRLRDRDPDSFVYCKADSKFLAKPVSFAKGYYVETSCSASLFVHNIKEFVNSCNVDYDAIVIRYRKRLSPKTETVVDEALSPQDTLGSDNPKENEVDPIVDFLVKSGLSFVDRRDKLGCLWVIGGREIENKITPLISCGISFHYKSGGGSATRGKDAWWTKDDSKSLKRAIPDFSGTSSGVLYDNTEVDEGLDAGNDILPLFEDWMIESGLSENVARTYALSTSIVDKFALSRGYSQVSLWQLVDDHKKLEAVWNDLIEDDSFWEYNGKKLYCLVKALNKFVAFSSSYYESEASFSETTQYDSRVTQVESVLTAFIKWMTNQSLPQRIAESYAFSIRFVDEFALSHEIFDETLLTTVDGEKVETVKRKLDGNLDFVEYNRKKQFLLTVALNQYAAFRMSWPEGSYLRDDEEESQAVMKEFIRSLVEKGILEETANAYFHALKSADLFALNYGLTATSFFAVDDVEEVKALWKKLLNDPLFTVYNTRKQNLIGNAMKQFIAFKISFISSEPVVENFFEEDDYLENSANEDETFDEDFLDYDFFLNDEEVKQAEEEYAEEEYAEEEYAEEEFVEEEYAEEGYAEEGYAEALDEADEDDEEEDDEDLDEDDEEYDDEEEDDEDETFDETFFDFLLNDEVKASEEEEEEEEDEELDEDDEEYDDEEEDDEEQDEDDEEYDDEEEGEDDDEELDEESEEDEELDEDDEEYDDEEEDEEEDVEYDDVELDEDDDEYEEEFEEDEDNVTERERIYLQQKEKIEGEFSYWMRRNGYSESTIGVYLGSLKYVNEYVLENDVSETSLYTIVSSEETSSLWNKLLNDPTFREYNLKKGRRFSVAMSLFLAFREEMEYDGKTCDVQTNDPFVDSEENNNGAKDFRTGFKNYLMKKYADRTTEQYLLSLKYIDQYVRNQGVGETPLFEIRDCEDVKSIWKQLSADPSFVDYNREKHRIYSAALKQYIAFREEIENGVETFDQQSRFFPEFEDDDSEEGTTDYRTGFEHFLRKKYTERTASQYLSMLKYVDQYALDHGYSKTPLFEIENFAEVQAVLDQLNADRSFVVYNREKHHIYSAPMQQYVVFREELQRNAFTANLSSSEYEEEDGEDTYGEETTGYRAGFEKYLRKKYASNTVKLYLNSLKYVDQYVLNQGYSTTPLFEIEAFEDVKTVRDQLNADQSFLDFNREKHNNYSAPMNQYVAFREELENDGGNNSYGLTSSIQSEPELYERRSEIAEDEEDFLVVDFENDKDFSFTEPISVSYLGNVRQADSWTKLYVAVYELLYNDYKDELDGLLDQNQNYVVGDEQEAKRFGKPVRFAPDRYVDAHESASALVRKIKRALDACGLEYNVLEIRYRKKSHVALKGEAYKRNAFNSDIEESERGHFDREIEDYRRNLHASESEGIRGGQINSEIEEPEGNLEHGKGGLPSAFASRVAELFDRKYTSKFKTWLIHNLMSQEQANSYDDALRMISLYVIGKGIEDRYLFAILNVSRLERILKELKDDPGYRVDDPAFDLDALRLYIQYRKSDSVSKLDDEIVERYSSALRDRFENGFRIDSFIDMKRFKHYYSECYGEDVSETDEEIVRFMKQVGTLRDGRVYLRGGASQNDLLDDVQADIAKAFRQGASCVYISCIFEKYRTALATQLQIYTEESLADRLVATCGRLYLRRKHYFYLGTEPDVVSDVQRTLEQSSIPMTIDQLQDSLWFLPIDQIKRAISRNPKTVTVAKDTYFFAPNFPASPQELDQIAKLMNVRLTQTEFMNDVVLRELIDENFPALSVDTADFTPQGLRAVLGALLGDRFSFKGPIISALGQEVSMSDAFGAFCEDRERMSFDELKEFADEMNSTIYWSSVFEKMLRLSETEFVKKGEITFDVMQIDDILSRIIEGDYAPIKDVNLFIHFPPISVKWNTFVLEGYVANYSREFILLHNSYSTSDCFGAIVKKSSRFKNLEDVMADVLARSDGWNSKEDALVLLSKLGYIQKRTFAKIDQTIVEAFELKNEWMNS